MLFKKMEKQTKDVIYEVLLSIISQKKNRNAKNK